MKRTTDRLGDATFDVLVIGGGIYGATIARAAALRGLNVALVEQGDFGQGASSNSMKVMHGGLRYLQHLNLKRMRESIIARRRLLQLAPHLVYPQAFVLPTYGYGMRSRFLMSAVFLVNDLIAWDRNLSVDPRRHIKGGKVLSRHECLDIMPGIKTRHLTGGAQWYDCVASDTERLTLLFVVAADEHGACVANYVRADKYLISGHDVNGVQVTDCLDGRVFDVHAHLVINTTGPWEDQLLQTLPGGGASGAIRRWARAVNIVVNRPIFGNHAVGITGGEKFIDKDAVVNKGSRYFFFLPWRGGTIIGTDYETYEGSPENSRLKPANIAALVREINRIYPAARLSVDDVSFSHAGLLPMRSSDENCDAGANLMKNERLLDLDKVTGIRGILSVTGVKYTTAIQVADKVADLAVTRLGYSRRRAVPDPPLAGGDRLPDGSGDELYGLTESSGSGAGNGSSLEAHLKQRYGTLYKRILQLVRDEPAYGQILAKGHETTAAEVIYAVREEMACKLSDVILRRTGLGNLGYPGKEAVRTAASIMAEELGWNEHRLSEEISALDLIYNVYTRS